MPTSEATPRRNTPVDRRVDVSIYQGYNVNHRVFAQIGRLKTPEERSAYYSALDDILAKNPEAAVVDIEDIRLPGMPPGLPGSDNRRTGVAQAVDLAKMRRGEVADPDDDTKTQVRKAATPGYREGMMLRDEDLKEIDEEEASKIEGELKAKIAGYDTAKSKIKE